MRSLPESQANRSPNTCPRNCGVRSAPRRRRVGCSTSPAARDAKWPEGDCSYDCAITAALACCLRTLGDGMAASCCRPVGWNRRLVRPTLTSSSASCCPTLRWETDISGGAFRGPHHRFTAEGIHGQFVLVDPEEHLVLVKLSSWKHAWEDDKEAETYAFFSAVADAVR